MTLFQDTGGDPRGHATLLADLLAFYGAVGDAALGDRPGLCTRLAATAVSLADAAQLPDDERDAVYLAATLHAIGAIGNRAHRAGESLPERIARMEGWDVPAQGARICEEIAELPRATADFVRWQAERWDGTGYPDQLRWHSIPKGASVLALAATFVHNDDPDETLSQVTDLAGRAFAPEMARAFTLWFHLGDVEAAAFPVEALTGASPASNAALFDRIADRVDAHLGVDGRWRRIARLCEGAAAGLGLDAATCAALGIAARTYGVGEIGSTPQAHDRGETSFDPLARLGIDDRAEHAVAAAHLLAAIPALRVAAPLLRARAEWFDGTGKPDGLASKAIPVGAAVLAAAVAYDALDHKDRVDDAAGTQFDPHVVRAVLEAARARA